MARKQNRLRCDEILELIKRFCDAHLNDEYKEVCCDMAEALCNDGAPVDRGKAAGWAAGVVFSVGFVNFLSDSNHTPYMTGEQIAKGFGISEATLMNRSRIIRNGFDLIRFDPDWTLPSRLEYNPLIWMMKLENGMIIDARSAPLEFQKSAYEAGLIPFIPKKRESGKPRLTLASEPGSLRANKPKQHAKCKQPIEREGDAGPVLS